jgi:hypothetical protein
VALGLGRPLARIAAVVLLVGMSLGAAETYLQHTRVVAWLEGLGSETLVMASSKRAAR